MWRGRPSAARDVATRSRWLAASRRAGGENQHLAAQGGADPEDGRAGGAMEGSKSLRTPSHGINQPKHFLLMREMTNVLTEPRTESI